MIEFKVDGRAVSVPDDGASLLGTLRDRLGVRSAKDGCSPQGQCGCCTVLIDGQPRVACVTPTRRVRGRTITTLAGFDEAEQQRWANAFCAAGASQCGFCTPGIIVRLAGLEAKKPDASRDDVDKALAAHLCRCTGWQTIYEAWDRRDADTGSLDEAAAARRAEIEGGVAQDVGVAVALGDGAFADDLAPSDALVAVRRADGEWIVGETVHQARELAGKVQGRRTTLEPRYPVEAPAGEWAATLQTTWTEPGYLETDAAWALPDGEIGAGPLGNAGAFGGKADSPVDELAQQLAAEHGQAVRVLFSREDTVRLGAKRPPVAGAARSDGTGTLRVGAVPPAEQAAIDAAVAHHAPGLVVEHIELDDELRASSQIRGAAWVEALCLVALATGETSRVTGLTSSAWAEADVDEDGIRVRLHGGQPLDQTVLRSYCIGAAHMATSLVRSEALAVDEAGSVQDLTIRSFGILKASDMPPVTVEIIESDDEPSNASDLVFGAVAAATSLHLNANRWPAG